MRIIDQAEELLSLKRESDEATGVAKDLAAKFREAKAAMAVRLAEEGMQNLKLATGETVFLTRQVQFNKRKEFTTEQICEALQACGMGDFVHAAYSPATIKAYVREADAATEDIHEDLTELLPEGVRSMFQSYEEATVGLRNAKK